MSKFGHVGVSYPRSEASHSDLLLFASSPEKCNLTASLGAVVGHGKLGSAKTTKPWSIPICEWPSDQGGL
jgi:hypothetical protein